MRSGSDPAIPARIDPRPAARARTWQGNYKNRASARSTLPLGALLCWAMLAPAAGGGAATRAWRCHNPKSGAGWTIIVDRGRGRVDGFAAEITALRIRWHDTRPGGGYYDLDRRSGDLRVVYGSSTGGWTLFDKCRPGE